MREFIYCGMRCRNCVFLSGISVRMRTYIIYYMYNCDKVDVPLGFFKFSRVRGRGGRISAFKEKIK